MKHSGVLLIAAFLLLNSCAFNFMDTDDDENDGPGAVTVTTATTTDTVEVRSTHTDSILQYTEEWYVSDPAASRRVNRIQRYSASGELLFSYAYGYNAEGQMASTAYYDAANALQWYWLFEYQTVNSQPVLSGQYTYTGANTLESETRYVYVDSGVATGQLQTYATFDAAGSLEAAVQYYFLSGSALWNMEASWNLAPGALGLPELPEVPYAGAVNAETVTHHGLITLSAPVFPDSLPVTEIPSDLSIAGTAAYRFSYPDTYGNTMLTLNELYKPTEVLRTDNRLEETVTVKIAYDNSGRISSKETWYGTTLALGLGISYDSGNFPVIIATSGEALLVHGTYQITWTASHALERIDLLLGDSVFNSFEFDYSGTPVPLTVSDNGMIDPFSFTGTLFAAPFTIRHLDGDENLIQSFAFTQVAATVEAIVRDADEVINGKYVIAYTDGAAGTLTAYGNADEEIWKREFGYGADFFTDLAADADLPSEAEIAALATDTGRLTETWLPDGVSTLDTSAYMTAFSESAIVDMVFDLLF